MVEKLANMGFVEYIAPNDLYGVWNKVEPFIADGLKKSAGEYDTSQIKVLLIQGAQHLLVMADEYGMITGAIVIEFVNFPNQRVAFIVSIGGKNTKDIFESLVEWCKNQKATSIRGCASEAVARLWRMQFDFSAPYLVVEKKL